MSFRTVSLLAMLVLALSSVQARPQNKGAPELPVSPSSGSPRPSFTRPDNANVDQGSADHSRGEFTTTVPDGSDLSPVTENADGSSSSTTSTTTGETTTTNSDSSTSSTSTTTSTSTSSDTTTSTGSTTSNSTDTTTTTSTTTDTTTTATTGTTTTSSGSNDTTTSIPPSVSPSTRGSGGFDGWSFFGGIIVTVVLMAIAFVGVKYYRIRRGTGNSGNYNRF